MLQQRLFNTNEDPQKYLFINTGVYIPISTCKFTKNCSYIVSGTSIPNSTSIPICSQYSENNHRFKVDVESPNLPEKDVELLYCLVSRLLYTSKITRPDIYACVVYIFVRMELPTEYHKDKHLDIDTLFVNKTQMFLILPLNDRYMHFKTLLSKHNKYIQKTQTNHSITKTQKFIHRYGRSFQEYG